MPVIDSDIHFYKSNTVNSDGGDIDTGSEIITAVDNNLFPDLTAVQAAAGGTRYRKMFVQNEHATDTLLAALASLAAAPGGHDISLALGLGASDDDNPLQGTLVGGGVTAQVITVHSDGADTRNVTVIGKDASGDYLEETVTLNGVTNVTTAASFLIVELVYNDGSSGTRAITIIRNAVTIGTIPVNERTTWFWQAVADHPVVLGDIVATGNKGIWIRDVWGAFSQAGAALSINVTVSGS